MKKEFILSDQEKQQKRAKIEENRVKKQQQKLYSNPATPTSPSSTDSASALERPQARVLPSARPSSSAESEATAEKLMRLSPSASSSPVTTVNNDPSAQQQQQQQQQQSSTSAILIKQELTAEDLSSSAGHTHGSSPQEHIPDFSGSHNLDDIIAVAIEAEFHVHDSTLAAASTNPQTATVPGLNEQERARMHELFVASRALVEPLDAEREPMDQPKNLISVINLTDLAIKRIIRMAKKITPFINMCQEDQVALLKGGCTEIMVLRSVINYNPDKNSWLLPSKDRPREVSMELLKEASQLGVNLYEEHQRFVKSISPEWRQDENVMLLLSAIALFTPSRANVLHQDVVKLEQDTYYYLLRRYLETVKTGCEPRRAYLHLIGRLKDLQRFNDSHIQVFLEVDPKLVAPLLIEVFDLNPSSSKWNRNII